MVRKIFIVLFAIAAGILGLVGYLYLAFPKIEAAESIRIEATQERLARGKYLSNHVNVCIDCHSTRDWTKYSGPLVPGTVGSGGEVFDQTLGFPGAFVAPNITPYNLSKWTDGEIFRAITSGVSKDGRPLFPIMPHPNYGKMSKEDLYSILVYVRGLESVKKENPSSRPDFPFNLILRTIPTQAQFGEIPDSKNKVAYGEYLTNAANCIDCHTIQEKGKHIEGMEFAGGFEFPLANGTLLRSKNITPDRETGIGTWTEAQFVGKFKNFDPIKYKPHAVGKGEFQTIMPWTMYAGMTESDIAAIYAYLQSIKPVRNQVN